MSGPLVMAAISMTTVTVMVTPEVFTPYQSVVPHNNNRHPGMPRNVPQPWRRPILVEPIMTKEL